MVYQTEKIVRDVRVCLEENTSGAEMLAAGDPDTLGLDELIQSKIEDAVGMVHKAAPAHMLENGHIFGDAVYWGDQSSGWVLLPEDFMRLISFKMSDWERSVEKAITTTDAEYTLQRQRVKALRGTPQRPVCAIAQRSEGKSLEFYSCKSDEAYVERGLYLPYPEIDSHGGIDISERCYRAAVYTAASLTLTSLGESDMAAALASIAEKNLK